MSDISIQFHALPSEVLLLVKESIQDSDLHAVSVAFFPFAAREILFNDLDKEILEGPAKRLIITLGKPFLGASAPLALYKQNPSALTVDIGRVTERGLAESALAARTEDAAALSEWKKIANRLRKMTKAGATAINSNTGAKSLLRNHRYTEGAKKLGDTGVAMLPIAGTAILKLGLQTKENP